MPPPGLLVLFVWGLCDVLQGCWQRLGLTDEHTRPWFIVHCICFRLPTLECAVPFQKMLLLQLQLLGSLLQHSLATGQHWAGAEIWCPA